MTTARLRIGISACMFHADPSRPVFNGKPLLYLERSMARWVTSQGALAYLVPEPEGEQGPSVSELAADLDGLVLQGGVDVSPRSYGEEPRRAQWSGDPLRDAYEMALVRAMVAREKPVLGVCRGHQVLNVVFGGSLHQDILDEVEGARVHRDATVYDRLFHEVAIVPGSSLAALHPGVSTATINSVHHQAVKRLGDGVVVEATSCEDGVVEAIAVKGPAWVRGVQWHPEFAYGMDRADTGGRELLDDAPILRSFLDAARARRDR